MDPTNESQRRSQFLDRTFRNVLKGQWKVLRIENAHDFIKSILSQKPETTCLERLASSRVGKEALHKSLTFNKSPEFMNTVVSDFLSFLENPQLRALCDGELLAQVIWAIVDPPLFWNNILHCARNGTLNTKALEGFAWLLLQLITLPSTQAMSFKVTAESIANEILPLDSCSTKTKRLMQQVRGLVTLPSTSGEGSFSSHKNPSPGGRHDNDFADYRDIAIVPTRGELLSQEKPYYLHAASIPEADVTERVQMHLGNQYRMLREDMIGEMQEEFRKVTSQKRKQGFRNIIIRDLLYIGFDQDTMKKERPCTLMLRCSSDVLAENLKIQDDGDGFNNRKKALKRVPAFLQHLSFGCLIREHTMLGFVSIDRNEDKLARNPPLMCLRVTSSDSLRQILGALQQGPLDYLQLSTPVFAYEPILERLQRKTDIELAEDILHLSGTPQLSTLVPAEILDSLTDLQNGVSDLQTVFQLSKPISLDPSQIQALIHGVKYQVSLIQGPPGTGKSLVGAILAKILLDSTDDTMLVLSFTNHALDQFIEDLIDIGIVADTIVRLGSKSTARTAPLLLSAQPAVSGVQGQKARYDLIYSHKRDMDTLLEQVDEQSTEFCEAEVTCDQMFQYLMFSEADGHFYDALKLPDDIEGETMVGRRGKRIQPDYLFERWATGKDAGVFAASGLDLESKSVWNLTKTERLAKIQQWQDVVKQDKLGQLTKTVEDFNRAQKTVQKLRKQKAEFILQSKRIIACTTTAASMHASKIQTAAPGIVVVEEAGEILESHILAAMGPATRHLIQIGDHKQLRPKVKDYKLSVESGTGFDLNRSLFERLVLRGHTSCTLLNQHRMRPEISELIKHHYPSLQDAPSTHGRPDLRGFQDNVIFCNHNHLESSYNALMDRSDPTMNSSKRNVFEADMIQKCVRYLGQQNYKTDNITILTPYLGQVSLLREKLNRDHDPILSDFDSHDLVEAGILPAASAEVNKRPIRLSTIDNYQGEESDIVIASLTRSNEDGQIGFMAAPERLNVLISRARNALIIIGSAGTFMNAASGRDEWKGLLDKLKQQGRIHDGFPIKCQKHPDRIMTIRSPDEFDLHCPDGGCTEPCSELLSCGKHTCPKRCHVLVDHSKVSCDQVINDTCATGHRLVWQCSEKRPPTCQLCRFEKEEKDRKARRDRDLERERQAKQRAYAKQLDAIKTNIARQRQTIKDRVEEQMRARTLHQHKVELERVTKEAQRLARQPDLPPPLVTVDSQTSTCHSASSDRQPVDRHRDGHDDSPDQMVIDYPEVDADEMDISTPSEISHTDEAGPTVAHLQSSAERDWQQQKELGLASNEALDFLMEMIGLEEVKKEFLTIKARVDTAVRQGVDLNGDRFGAALLGNPGTGKTTVARLYGRFLSSMGVIPGSHFEETTGSRLAHEGIQGAQKLLDNILQGGGGIFFLDEAYQIVSSSSFGGSQVLDFLLTEIENCTGRVVFVFAGYHKQMEAFFSHNPGIPSRIPIRLDFLDYDDSELLQLMRHELEKKFSGRLKIEGGADGLYMRITSRRIGRGRGREGFGNAREVHNALAILLRRQADRLHKSRQRGENPDDLMLRMIDIIGPEPSNVMSVNKDWQRLCEMVGLESVKESLQALFDRLQTNYERELNEQPLIECSLNKVFAGNPGTGKTTVAKLYGRILAAMGLLSNGEVVVKSPADFTGSALGQSEKNTKAILEATKGKVLIIDEAYMLGNGLSEAGGLSDPYKTAVIDTIVAEVQSNSLEDRCVILLGYREQMEHMFQEVNPGLARRFPMSSAFVFEDYNDTELESILDLKLNQQGFQASEVAKKACISVLSRARNRPNFGNAGEVDIVLDRAKERQQKRLVRSEAPGRTDWLEPQDIDPDFNRLDQAVTNIHMLFAGVIGCEYVVEKLEGYQREVQTMREIGFPDTEIRAQIPFSLLFRGPPGTGKTSTARKMGEIYYDLGFLRDARVIECSATDIIGQYVGQTGPKVQKKFDEALGRVLFIDEAYRLSGDHYAKEAMDEIVDCLTKERYHNKILVILAGYDDDINHLMNQNPGLTSRFPETISFYHMRPSHCHDLLFQCLAAKKLDTTQLEASPTLDAQLLSLFETLIRTPSWGNARDVQTLAKSIFGRMMKAGAGGATQVVPESIVLDAVKDMVEERSTRATLANQNPRQSSNFAMEFQSHRPDPPQIESRNTMSKKNLSAEQATLPDSIPPESIMTQPAKEHVARRDAKVSDEVWQQLEHDKAAEESRQHELAELRREAAELEQQTRATEEDLQRQRDDAARREVLRQLEILRTLHEMAERERRALEDRAIREAAAKAKLKRMGCCPVGYEWIPQTGGYRCAGGSHFMTDEALGDLE